VCLIKLPINIFFHAAIKQCFLILHFEFMFKFIIKIYLLTPWSRVLLEKLTSKLCS